MSIILFIILVYLYLHFSGKHFQIAGEKFIVCYGNVTYIGSQLLYYKEKNGCYPKDLKEIKSLFRKEIIPNCPSSNQDYFYELRNNGRAFCITCKGWNHAGFCDENYPQYSSDKGLIVLGCKIPDFVRHIQHMQSKDNLK